MLSVIGAQFGDLSKNKVLFLPEGPIVQGAEKSVFVRCLFVVVRPGRYQSNLDIFQVFVDTIVERVRWCDTPIIFGSEIWPLHE